MQALEAIKVATGVGEPLSGRMLLFDALSARIRIVGFSTFGLLLLMQP
jgi:adenylyltransferase/sulfurtransferase